MEDRPRYGEMSRAAYGCPVFRQLLAVTVRGLNLPSRAIVANPLDGDVELVHVLMVADDCLDLSFVDSRQGVSSVDPRLPKLQPATILDNPEKTLRARPIPGRVVQDVGFDAKKSPM